jgi:hypothetical protein
MGFGRGGEHARHRLIHLFGGAGHALAERGQHQAIGLTQHERATECLFERRQAPPHRRVLDAEFARRAGERTGARRGEQVAQVVPVESLHAGHVAI